MKEKYFYEERIKSHQTIVKRDAREISKQVGPIG